MFCLAASERSLHWDALELKAWKVSSTGHSFHHRAASGEAPVQLLQLRYRGGATT